MAINATNLNTGISNISWYRGIFAQPVKQPTYQSNNVVIGNPNRPEVLNGDPNAGIVRTFDSFKCFGYEKC